MKPVYKYILWTIFLVTFVSRLYFAFQTEGYSDDSAYYIIREVEHIKETGLPLYNDELSFSGRTYLSAPLYHYILAFFDYIIPYSFKIIPNLFASILIFIVFFIAIEISKKNVASLFTAFISGFVPIFFGKTVNSISVYSLVIPLTFFMMLCLLKINNDKRFILYFIISSFALALTHASAFLIMLALLVYLIFIKIEDFTASKAEFELILFSTLLITWIQFLLYKNAFLTHGVSLIWQNIPKVLLSAYFVELDLLKAIYVIGLVPFIFGIYIIYHSIFREKKKYVYLLISFIVIILLLLWLRLVELDKGLIFLGILLTLMFSYFLRRFLLFLERTRVSAYKNYFIFGFVIVFIISSVIPSFILASSEIELSFSDEELKALTWLRENTEDDSVILASAQEGNIITNVAKKKNVLDTNFLLINNIDQRIKDVKIIFLTVLQTEAISLLNKYNVDYIYFSERAKEEYRIDKISYIDDICFDLIYDKGIEIYEVKCRLEEQ